MSAAPAMVRSAVPASHLLGRKLDSIPFSPYHVVLIVVLGFVGFIEGYDLALSGSLLVLAKAAAEPGPRRDPRPRRMADLRRRPRWLRGGGDVGSHQPGGRDAGRRRHHHAVHPADPVGAGLHATAGPAPGHRHRARLHDLGAVSDRSRADAGATSTHLRRYLRGHARQRLHPAAVCRLHPRRSPERLSSGRAARWGYAVRRTRADLFPDPREPTLAAATRPRPGCGRHG